MKLMMYLMLAWSLALICSAKDHYSRDWPERDQETVQRTLPLTGSPMRLVVDNVQGYVHVKGVAGSDVRVTAHKSIRAETDSDLAQARSEVKLDITQQPGSVSVYYDAPWRCNGKGAGCHGNQRHFYDVSYDIDIEAPVAARLVISTVNGGAIQIDQTTGDFDVSNVNGGIEMSGVAGSGDLRTVNGPVKVRFAHNPTAASSFKSVNGPLDVWFQRDFSADLLFKTLNGQVYSDFEVTPRAIPALATTEQRDGKFVYRSHGKTGGRAGAGGPELNFDTLNGSIRLHREE